MMLKYGFISGLLGLMSLSSVAADNRIISAGSSVTEIIYALGAEQQLVAIDLSSRYYDEAGALPQVGYLRQLSAEGLMALQPNYLLGSEEMGPESTLHQLASAGIKVETLTAGDDKSAFFARIDKLASITSTEDQAEVLKQSISQRWQQLEQQSVKHSPLVMFAMLSKGRPATIAGAQTTIDEIIHLAGGSNPAHEEMNSYKPISFEALVGMQPDYLLVSQRSWDSLGGFAGILTHFPLLAETPAAINKQIVPIPSSAIIGGLGIESVYLAEQLQQQFITSGE